MKIKKISIVLGSLGIFVIFIFTYKFFIKSDFTSMWLVGLGIGAGCLFGAYLYSWMRDTIEKIEKVNKRLDAFSEWFIKNKEFG
jgi:hypothetical protein